MENPMIIEFKDLFLKAIGIYAKKFAIPELEVQIAFRLDVNGEIYYEILKNFMPSEEKDIKFRNLLGVKIDLSGKSMFVPPVLTKVLHMLNAEGRMDDNKASVIIAKRTPEVTKAIETLQDIEESDNVEEEKRQKKNAHVRLMLYNGKDYVKEVFLIDIISNIEIG